MMGWLPSECTHERLVDRCGPLDRCGLWGI